MRAHWVVMTGLLVAVAFLLMATVQLPILPQAPFLKYDPSDAAALVGGVLYGPGTGVLVVFLKDVLFFLFRAKGPFGPLADFIAAGTFVAVTAWAYRRMGGPFPWRLLSAATVGMIARVLVMIPANFVILYLEFGMPPARVAGLLLPAIVPFNAVKATLNALLALVVAEPLGRYLPAPEFPER
ncbi:MAG: ECF transporter S component [Armatimonadota bacterium]|nr:ECF transporter S component [Armatimonadota bacterium]